MSSPYVLLRWDNNYRFGGVQTVAQMKAIQKWLVSRRLATIVVASKRMTLLKLDPVAQGPARSAKSFLASSRQSTKVASLVSSVDPSSERTMVTFVPLGKSEQTGLFSLRAIGVTPLELTATVLDRGPAEIYFAGADYVRGHYRAGAQWFPYEVRGRCRPTNAGWVMVWGSCSTAFTVTTGGVAGTYAFDRIEMVTRSYRPSPSTVTAQDIVLTTRVASVPAVVSRLGPETGGFVDTGIGPSSGFAVATVAPDGVTRVLLRPTDRRFLVVVPEAFNGSLGLKVTYSRAPNIAEVRCTRHVVVDGFLDGWLCNAQKKGAKSGAARTARVKHSMMINVDVVDSQPYCCFSLTGTVSAALHFLDVALALVQGYDRPSQLN